MLSFFLICEITYQGFKFEKTEEGEARVTGMDPIPDKQMDIVIPSYIEYQSFNLTVTSIGQKCFLQNQYILHVTLPNNLIEIEEEAFADSSISSVVLSESLQKISSRAFYYCVNLKCDIICPKSLQEISESSFEYSSITSFDGSKSTAVRMGEHCFCSCMFLEKIEFPPNLDIIPRYFCSSCHALKGNIIFPANLSDIGAFAFFQTSIESVTFNIYLETIGDYAFSGCQHLSGTLNLGIPNLSYIGDFAFWENGITNIIFPGGDHLDNPNCIFGQNAFSHCKIKDLCWDLSAKNKRSLLFFECKDLESVVIDFQRIDTGLGIPERFCVSCSSLKRVTFYFQNNKTWFIGNEAFYGCTALETIALFPEGIESIGKDAFYQCKMLSTKFEFQKFENLTSIGERAFYQCESLRGELLFPPHLKKISYSCFCGCKFTGSVYIPDSVQAIEDYSFFGCIFEGSVKIGKNVTSIGASAFAGCSQLSGTISFEGNDVLITIGDRAFLGCSKLSGHLILPKSLIEIRYGAFEGCINLYGALEFGPALKEIGEYAFADCSKLSGELVIPSSVSKIGSYAFTGCTGLTEVHMNNKAIKIGEKAFSRMHNKCFSGVPDYFNETYYDSDNFDGMMVKEWMNLNMNCKVFNSIDNFLVALVSIASAVAGMGIFGFIRDIIVTRSEQYNRIKEALKCIMQDILEGNEESDEDRKVQDMMSQINDRFVLESREPDMFITEGQARAMIKELVDELWPAISPSNRRRLIESSTDDVIFPKWYERFKLDCNFKCWKKNNIDDDHPTESVELSLV